MNKLRGTSDSTVEEGKFTVVDEKDSKTSKALIIPSTLDGFDISRHPLAKEKVTPEIEKIQKELEIDKKLGLAPQAVMTANQALSLDINELTKSNNYMEVTPSLLGRLFNITRLKLMCWTTNVKSFFEALLPDCLTPVVSSVICLALVPLFAFLSSKCFMHHPSWIVVSECVGIIIGWGLNATLAGFAIYKWVNLNIVWDSINVKVNTQLLSTVTAKIPMGAKLKVLEAQETKIFDEFIYAYPLFSIEKREIDVKKYIPRINIDPAILGRTKDDRMFMIVYWDIKRDVEHVIEQISEFRKFKVTE
jgi:hypothetical protein